MVIWLLNFTFNVDWYHILPFCLTTVHYCKLITIHQMAKYSTLTYIQHMLLLLGGKIAETRNYSTMRKGTYVHTNDIPEGLKRWCVNNILQKVEETLRTSVRRFGNIVNVTKQRRGVLHKYDLQGIYVYVRGTILLTLNIAFGYLQVIFIILTTLLKFYLWK